MRKTIEERFWGKVNKNGPKQKHMRTKCWEWTARRNLKGYGTFFFNKGNLLAHRVSWSFNHGAIPAGLCVLHHCDHPMCIRPSHLYVGTDQDNCNDRTNRGRHSCKPRRGVLHGRSKLTEIDVLQIRELYKGRGKGPTQDAMAKRFGIRGGHVSDIINRKKWAHI